MEEDSESEDETVSTDLNIMDSQLDSPIHPKLAPRLQDEEEPYIGIL